MLTGILGFSLTHVTIMFLHKILGLVNPRRDIRVININCDNFLLSQDKMITVIYWQKNMNILFIKAVVNFYAPTLMEGGF